MNEKEEATTSTSSSSSSSSSSSPAYLSLPAPSVVNTTQARSWVFTLNNYSSVDVPRTVDGFKYLTWQAEKGANGTPHLQGYTFTLESRLRFNDS